MYILIFSIFTFLIIELLIFFIFKKFKKNFQWLIDNSDLYPKFSNGLIKKYNEKIFNKDLGWDNQTNKKRVDNLKIKGLNLSIILIKRDLELQATTLKPKKLAFWRLYAFCRSSRYQTIQHCLRKN